MKLSDEELAQLGALVPAAESGAHRATTGMPGGRDQPISYSALLAQRVAMVGARRG